MQGDLLFHNFETFVGIQSSKIGAMHNDDQNVMARIQVLQINIGVFVRMKTDFSDLLFFFSSTKPTKFLSLRS